MKAQANQLAFFLTFEGGEGSGKSTQAKILAAKLQKQGISVLLTREPGATEAGKVIRQLLLSTQTQSLAPITELLLYSADRYQHVSEKILPALQNHTWVISDRFVDSTLVYQGEGRSIEKDTLHFLCKLSSHGLKPDLSFLLDLPVELGLQRSQARLQESQVNEGRFENETLAFHQKVREGFLQLSQAEPQRFRRIDATQSVESVSAKIWQEVEILMKRGIV